MAFKMVIIHERSPAKAAEYDREPKNVASYVMSQFATETTGLAGISRASIWVTTSP